MAMGMHIPTMKIKKGQPTSTIVIVFGDAACHSHFGIFVTLKLPSFRRLVNIISRMDRALNTSIEVRRVWTEMSEIFTLLSAILSLLNFSLSKQC